MRRAILLIISFNLLMTACVSHRTDEYMPDVDMSLSEMNKNVSLSAPPDLNTLKTCDLIFVDVKINSGAKIIFAPDFGAKLFRADDDIWIELEDSMERQNNQVVLPSNSNFASNLAVFAPVFSTYSEPQNIRIIVTGHIFRHGEKTDESVGAFIDLSLDGDDCTGF